MRIFRNLLGEVGADGSAEEHATLHEALVEKSAENGGEMPVYLRD